MADRDGLCEDHEPRFTVTPQGALGDDVIQQHRSHASGDQVGDTSMALLLVRRRSPPPPRSTEYSSVFPPALSTTT